MNAALLRARNLVWQAERYRTEYGTYTLCYRLETGAFHARLSRLLYVSPDSIPRITGESLYGVPSLMLTLSEMRRLVDTVYSLGTDP